MAGAMGRRRPRGVVLPRLRRRHRAPAASPAPLSAEGDAVAQTRQQLATWLARRGVTDIAFTETHVSMLAFSDDRVWKCKKPVRLAFADFTTLERRADNCRRELALNRRL